MTSDNPVSEKFKGSENGHQSNSEKEFSPPEDQSAIAPVTSAPDVNERGKWKIVILMFALCMAVFLAALDITIITTALPTIAEEFASAAVFTWVGSAYLLAVAASTTIWAKLSDIFGRKPMLLAANIVFFVGTLVCALSRNVPAMLVGRAFQGVGGGGLLTLVNVVIGDLFSMRVRGMYYGIIGLVWAISSGIGPVIGGAFTEKVSWRWCFWINVPIQGITFLILIFFLKIHREKVPLMAGLKAIDWIGVILMVGGIIMFLLGLQFGGATYPWSSATVLCLIISGCAALVLFGFHEVYLAKYPLIPGHIFNHHSNMAAFGACFCHGFAFIGASYYLPLYFQGVLGNTPIISGVILLAYVVPLSIMTVVSGFYIRSSGKYLPSIWLGFTFMTIGFGLFTLFKPQQQLGKIIPFLFIAGLGTGPNFQAPLIALQSLVPPSDIAAAVSTFQLFRNVATSMSVVIGGVVFQNAMSRYRSTIESALGPDLAQAFAGSEAAASVELIQTLPPNEKIVAITAFTNSLNKTWILYVAVAGVGLLISLIISKQRLTQSHKETKTGLAAEEARRLEREERRQSRRKSKSALPTTNNESRSNSVAQNTNGHSSVEKSEV